MDGRQFLILCFAGWTFGCRPEPAGDLTLLVEASHAYTGEPVSGIDFELERRVLENGVLNGNYQWVGSETTESNGRAEFHFKRVNALDYQLKLVSSDWFNRSDFIHPDAFITQTEVSTQVEATPRGTVHIRLVNAFPFDEADQIQFRTLNIPGEYLTCSNAWESHTGEAVQVERTCDVEADRYLPYLYVVTRNNESIETLDSIWVPRGVLTELEILY
ncbi:MAG: hypothetical protein ACO2ZL_00765 [Flavobacteriales bacterium]